MKDKKILMKCIKNLNENYSFITLKKVQLRHKNRLIIINYITPDIYFLD